MNGMHQWDRAPGHWCFDLVTDGEKYCLCAGSMAFAKHVRPGLFGWVESDEALDGIILNPGDNRDLELSISDQPLIQAAIKAYVERMG